MKLNEGLIAGSRRWDELVVIHYSPESSPERLSSRRICQICGDEIGYSSIDGEPFVACNECAFPICPTCYDYERQEASQLCPLCKTRFRRIKGFARVEGDPEEDDADDVENEFNFVSSSKRTDVPTSGKHFHDDDVTYDADADSDTLSGCKLSFDSQHDYSLHHTCGHMVVHGSGEPKRKGFPSRGPASNRSLDPSRDMAAYGYGSVAWKERLKHWKLKQETTPQIVQREAKDDKDGIESHLHLIDEARQPLSRKLAIPSTQINPYRIIVILRLVVLGFFFHYRFTHPVKDAFGLWLVSVICEVWFAISWILNQLTKWFPLGGRETYLDRLSLRYEQEGKPSELSAVDIFVSTVDPMKEPPLVTANTLLSILAVDYPIDKVSCYVSDDGASILTFEALSETAEFARKWVPFCKKFNIEPRAPEVYFSKKIDYFNEGVLASFVRERRAMKREYDEFKVRINALVTKAQKIPEEGWTMQDGTPWPGNNVRDHPGIIQVLLGQEGDETDNSDENNLPRLVYVSREKKPGYNHHSKAGAMNALVRVSAVLTNATYLLNLDFDHYINNSKALREAMCFMMDPLSGQRVCFVQFSPRFDGVDTESNNNNNNNVFFDINMRALDGIQGPMYVGTGSVFRRKAFYGYDAPPKRHKSRKRLYSCCLKWCYSSFSKRKSTNKPKSKMKTVRQDDNDDDLSAVGRMPLHDMEQEVNTKLLKTQNKLEKKFGQSSVFVAATLQENGGTVKGFNPATFLKEAIHVISCGYENKTEWGTEVGWIYGSVTSEDMLTCFKMHCHGWRSIYSTPERSAFKGSAPIDLPDRLHQKLRLALGSADIFFSRHSPLWYGYGGGLKYLERLAYINATIYTLTSVPLVVYCALPAVCLLTGKFIVPEMSSTASMWFLSLFMSVFATSLLEMRWSGVSMNEWWQNQQFRVMETVSAYLVAAFTSMVKVVAGIDSHVPSSKAGEENGYEWTMILIPPITLLVINLIGVIAGVSNAISTRYGAWGALFGRLFYALCVVVYLYPFLGVMLKKKRVPTVIILWSLLTASVFSILWIKIDPFLAKSNTTIYVECGLDCTIL